MSIVIKVFGGGLVGVLAVGLFGCGYLFPSTFHSPNPYSDLYKAKDLRDRGKYKAALAKYEKISKKHPQTAFGRKVIDVEFPTGLKYDIAFCYAKLAETEGDVSFYIKAAAAARESYQTAIHPFDQADALYLWGYILFKQEHYEEARAKFEALLEILQQDESEGDFTADTFFALGKTYLELADKCAAQRVFAQLEARVEADLREFRYHFLGIDSYEETLFGLGEVYLELGDEVAAQRVFGRLLVHFPDTSYKSEVQRLLEKQ